MADETLHNSSEWPSDRNEIRSSGAVYGLKNQLMVRAVMTPDAGARRWLQVPQQFESRDHFVSHSALVNLARSPLVRKDVVKLSRRDTQE
jgi:hypothetical protein